MLGILGGMGPMATVDFMRKLVEATPASCDQDHLETLTCSATAIPDRTAAILGRGADPLPALRDAVRRLERGGATRIAMPCNTAHHWHAALQAATPVPILHIVDAVVAALARDGIHDGVIGLLATTGTLHAGVYQERFCHRGLLCRVPPNQDAVMQAIGLIKAGAMPHARRLLTDQVEALSRSGCRKIVLACTEIPVVLDACDARLLDATQALAQACVAACLAQPRADVAALAGSRAA